MAHGHEKLLSLAKPCLTCSPTSRPSTTAPPDGCALSSLETSRWHSTTGAPSGLALQQLNLADDWPVEFILAGTGQLDPECVEWLLSMAALAVQATQATAEIVTGAPWQGLRPVATHNPARAAGQTQMRLARIPARLVAPLRASARQTHASGAQPERS